MKKTNKLQELVSNQVANALETVKNSKEAEPKKVSKSSTKKSKAAKAEDEKSEEPKKNTVKEVAKEEPAKATKTSKKEETVKEVAAQQSSAIIENVVSKREVKYIYPDDVVDTLARKKWRQHTRNELHRLEREMLRIKDHNSKEFKEAEKKFKDYQSTVLKPNQVA